MPDQEWELESPAFGELLASCAAADAVSRPPGTPEAREQERKQEDAEREECEAA